LCYHPLHHYSTVATTPFNQALYLNGLPLLSTTCRHVNEGSCHGPPALTADKLHTAYSSKLCEDMDTQGYKQKVLPWNLELSLVVTE